MRILVAGASGAIGRRLVPLLVQRGHDVVGTTRCPAKAEVLRAAGAQSAILDILDVEAVRTAVCAAVPEVVVHEATALAEASLTNLRRFDKEFAATNRLRTEGTDHLLAATRSAGARRFVAQSFAGWPYAREGSPVKAEDDPLDPDPPRTMRRTLAAIRYLETAVVGADGIDGVVLRYGVLYGPGTSLGTGESGVHVEAIRKGRFPIVGSGGGVWSFVHIDDAVGATQAAIERGKPGIYNVVDDEPARVAEWLPALATAVGATPPRRVPGWLGRLLAGEAAVTVMTDVRGATNAKAKRELGWRPQYPTWREGFREGSAPATVGEGIDTSSD